MNQIVRLKTDHSPIMRTAIRIFISLWYLLGWISHVYLGLFSSQMYAAFGSTAHIPAYTGFWHSFVMPNITLFALLLAAFEIGVGLLLVSKGKWVKLGLALSILFNLFLVQMGLSYQTASPLQDFAINRFPNIIFILLQIPLFWGRYDRSIPEIIRRK